MSWLLWIILQWTQGCKYLVEIRISFVSVIYPEAAFLDHMVILFLIFWGTSILFSIVAAQFTFPPTAQGFQFLNILANTCYLLSYWWDPFSQMWGDITLWFWFAFPWWLVMLSIFSCTLWPLSLALLLPIFHWLSRKTNPIFWKSQDFPHLNGLDPCTLETMC